MAKPKRDVYVVNISFRLYGDEGRRWDTAKRTARKVDEDANKTDVVRALLGLPPDSPDKKALLTDADRAAFAAGVSGADLEAVKAYFALPPETRAMAREMLSQLQAVPANERPHLVMKLEDKKKRRA